MKNFSIISVASIALFCTLNISAATQEPAPGNLIINIKQHKSTASFSLQIANLQQLDASITLLTTTGEVLHSRQIENSNGFHIKYKLGAFPDGIYKLEINWDKQTKVWKIYKNKGVLEFQLTGKKKKEGVWRIHKEAQTSQE